MDEWIYLEWSCCLNAHIRANTITYQYSTDTVCYSLHQSKSCPTSCCLVSALFMSLLYTCSSHHYRAKICLSADIKWCETAVTQNDKHRQSMPSRQDNSCPSKHAPQDRQSMLSRRPTWNLEVMSKCFFMSVPSTWFTDTTLSWAMASVEQSTACSAHPLCVSYMAHCLESRAYLAHHELESVDFVISILVWSVVLSSSSAAASSSSSFLVVLLILLVLFLLFIMFILVLIGCILLSFVSSLRCCAACWPRML